LDDYPDSLGVSVLSAGKVVRVMKSIEFMILMGLGGSHALACIIGIMFAHKFRIRVEVDDE
jgi:hypothetical protein